MMSEKNKLELTNTGCCGQHNHDQGQGCGCSGHHHDHDHHHGHDHDHEGHDHSKIYLETEDGKELECDVLGVFDFEDQEYIALIPVESETAFLYRYSEVEEEPALSQIESDDEYERVSAYFMELVEAEEE